MQPVEVVTYPEVSEGVPGYTPPKGRGYQALQNGSTVFVRTPGYTRPKTVHTPSEGSTTRPSIEAPGLTTPVNVGLQGLTKPGPPGKVWSWQVVRRTQPPTSMLSILAQASSSTLISNSFERLHVDHIETTKAIAHDADMAYNAHRSQANPCPIKVKKLKKAYKKATEAVLDAINAPSCAANPYPSVDPASREYYVCPYAESPPPGPINEGSEVGENPLDF